MRDAAISYAHESRRQMDAALRLHRSNVKAVISPLLDAFKNNTEKLLEYANEMLNNFTEKKKVNLHVIQFR
tara:strand:- start:727 stop:939 length:213 start_codon:yes stop_codon:yes gene_type:complete